MGAEPYAIAGSSLAASASVDGYNSADEHEVAVSAPAETIEAFAARMAATRGLQLVPMLRDGNCLFRAVAESPRAEARQQPHPTPRPSGGSMTSSRPHSGRPTHPS